MPSRRVIALDGRSGAGKTGCAQRLADALRAAGHQVDVIHLDDLYPGWDGLEAGVETLVRHVLRPLRSGATELHVPRWDWTAMRPGEPLTLVPRPLLIVEGVGCGARACAPFLDLLAWIEAPDAARRDRALARDGEVYAPHWQRWAAQERAHFGREATRDRADVVVDVP